MPARPGCLRRHARPAVRAGAVLLTLWLAASFGAERLVLHPRHWGAGAPPSARGWVYEDVAFKDSSGLTLRGWWIPGTRAETVVLIHGWTSSRREPMDKAAPFLHATGYNLLAFDLRGHGLSDGDYTTLGWLEPDDVMAAVRFAKSRAPGPLALLGYSMGAAAAVEAGSRDPTVAAVIEDSGFSSLGGELAARFQRVTGLGWWPLAVPTLNIATWDLQINPARVRPIDDAARLTKPLLAIVGERDTTVPPAQGLAIYDAARGPKQLLDVPAAGHTEAAFVAPDLYRDTVLGFLDRYLG